MKIGVLAGAFDPVHLGHKQFIKRAIIDNNLDEVHVLVEKKSYHKSLFASYRQRLEMTKLCLSGNQKIKIVEHDFQYYPISAYIKQIRNKPNIDIYLLIGADVKEHIYQWQDSDNLLKNLKLIVAKRDDSSEYGRVSSLKIRRGVAERINSKGLDPTVAKYITYQKIYKNSGE